MSDEYRIHSSHTTALDISLALHVLTFSVLAPHIASLNPRDLLSDCSATYPTEEADEGYALQEKHTANFDQRK